MNRRGYVDACVLICCLMAFVFLFFQWTGARIVELKLTKANGTTHRILLPYKDARKLQYFFEQLFIGDNFAYTLLGDKPLSFESYIKPRLIFDIDWPFLPRNIRLHQGWQTWQKYAPLFLSNTYSLWAEDSHRVENATTILFANKPAIYEMARSHPNDFQDVDLYEEIKTKAFFKEVLKGHEGLIGTLLGYGRNNAWAFMARETDPNVFLTRISYAEECDEKLFCYPFFVVDPHAEETKNLSHKYQQTRKKILAYYEGKDFLEATLEQLAKNETD